MSKEQKEAYIERTKQICEPTENMEDILSYLAFKGLTPETRYVHMDSIDQNDAIICETKYYRNEDNEYIVAIKCDILGEALWVCDLNVKMYIGFDEDRKKHVLRNLSQKQTNKFIKKNNFEILFNKGIWLYDVNGQYVVNSDLELIKADFMESFDKDLSEHCTKG